MKAVSDDAVKYRWCRARIATWLAVTSVLYGAQAWSATQPRIQVNSVTREADYTIGSIARQRLTVHLPPGYVLDAASLPVPAQNEAIELRDARWQVQDMPHERLLTLDIDWQIFVAGNTAKIMPLKKLHLEFQRGQSRLAVDVPADKVIVSSLLPARIDAEHVKLYPDVPPPAWSLRSQLWSLAAWLGLLVLGMLYVAWYLGWIALPQEKRMPFRQAWRTIRRLGPTSDATARMQAMRVFSHAMDQFAGYTVTAENLSQLLARQAVLQPHQAALQGFYHALQQTFFAGETANLSLDHLRRLARTLSQLEVS